MVVKLRKKTGLKGRSAPLVVMIICHYDDTNSSGGLEKQARLLSHSLRAAGENVVMLASTRKWSRAGWRDDHGVPVRFFWTYASPQISGRYLPAALIWAFQLLFWIVCHHPRISLIHGHQIRIHAFVAAFARKLFGIPAILKSGTGGAGADIRAIGSRKYLGSPGRNFIIRNTDCFIATTKSVEDDLLAFSVPGKNIRLIPNGLAMTAPLAGAAPQLRARRALFLGRLARDKNAPALAQAAAKVAHKDSLIVHFYGRGSELEQLEAIIANSGNPAVAYRGFVSDTEIILLEYGYLLLPSSAEGLSNAMLEAMSQGVVPIATRVSGCIDHITPGVTGFFFDGTDQASLIRGLKVTEELSVEQWRAMSNSARAYARQRFDLSELTKSYKELYTELTHSR